MTSTRSAWLGTGWSVLAQYRRKTSTRIRRNNSSTALPASVASPVWNRNSSTPALRGSSPACSIISRWLSRKARTSGASWRATTLATLSISMASRIKVRSSRRGSAVLQVQRDGVNAGLRLGFCHHQPAAGPAPGGGDGVILQQPHRFSKHGAADPIALQQRDLGAEDLPHLPAAAGDVVADRGGQHFGELALRRFAVGSCAACATADRGGDGPAATWSPTAACCSLSVIARAASPAVTAATMAEWSRCRCSIASNASLAESSRESSAYRTVSRMRISINNCSTGFFDCSASAAWNSSFARIGLAVLLGPQHAAESVDARFVDLLRRPRCRQRLQQQPRIQQVADRGAQVFQVDDDGVGCRCGVRLADQQSAVRAAPHARHLVMLDESDCFPQHRPAHPVTLLQRLLRAERLPDRPATPDDVGLDATRDL